MINDKNIEVDSAKYWCIFNDIKLLDNLKQAEQYTPEDGKKLAKIISKVKADKKKDESENVNEVDWAVVNSMHQSAFPMATGNPLQPNFNALDPNWKGSSFEKQQKENIIAGAVAALFAGAYFIPGGWAALGSAIAAIGGATGSWVASVATAATTTAANIGAAGITALIGGIVSISSYLYPRIAMWLRGMGRNGVIAKCTFISSDTPYVITYCLSKNKWELEYDNNRWIRSGTKIDPVSKEQFFNTVFFERFKTQCQKYISAILDDDKNVEVLKTLSKMSDKKSSNLLTQILDNKQKIQTNMYRGIYLESENNI